MPDPSTYLSRIPDLADGKRFPSMPLEVAATLFAELLAAPNADIAALIGTLHVVDDGSDWKTRFLLKALASHSQGVGRTKVQSAFTDALNAEHPATVKTFLVMQLQWIGDADAIDALTAQLTAEDPALIDAAAAALTAIGQPAVKPLQAAGKRAAGHAKDAIDHALRQIART